MISLPKVQSFNHYCGRIKRLDFRTYFVKKVFCLGISIQGKMYLNIRQISYFDRESSNEIDQPSKIGSAGHIIMLNSRGLHKFTFQNSFDLVYSHFVAVNFKYIAEVTFRHENKK